MVRFLTEWVCSQSAVQRVRLHRRARGCIAHSSMKSSRYAEPSALTAYQHTRATISQHGSNKLDFVSTLRTLIRNLKDQRISLIDNRVTCPVLVFDCAVARRASLSLRRRIVTGSVCERTRTLTMACCRSSTAETDTKVQWTCTHHAVHTFKADGTRTHC